MKLKYLVFSMAIIIICTLPGFGAEPIKRQTAIEIYTVLFNVPYGADIRQVYKVYGTPMHQEADFIVYQHQRTGCNLFICKTPFNTVQYAFLFEECDSETDASTRAMLITEQFKRRFGDPVTVENGIAMWNLKDIAALSVYLSADKQSVVYRLDPFPGR